MIEQYKIKVLRSDGLSLCYESEDFSIISLEGADFPQIEVFKEPRGVGNGDIITGKRKLSREITVEAMANNLKSYRACRQRIIGFHNSNYTYDVEITYMGVKRIAKDCILSAVGYPTEGYTNNPMLTAKYLSPHSDLFADSSEAVSLISSKALWHDTRVYEGRSGRLAFSEQERARGTVINYIGSEPAPLKITINASGYVSGINIQLENNRTRIKSTLRNGDKIIIDCEKSIVFKNGNPEPLAMYVADELKKLTLNYGDNVVSIDSGGTTAFTTDISYTGRYGGL